MIEVEEESPGEVIWEEMGFNPSWKLDSKGLKRLRGEVFDKMYRLKDTLQARFRWDGRSYKPILDATRDFCNAGDVFLCRYERRHREKREDVLPGFPVFNYNKRVLDLQELGEKIYRVTGWASLGSALGMGVAGMIGGGELINSLEWHRYAVYAGALGGTTMGVGIGFGLAQLLALIPQRFIDRKIDLEKPACEKEFLRRFSDYVQDKKRYGGEFKND